MNILAANGFDSVYHVTPLHYVPYLARDGYLRSKSLLRSMGFPDFHFRSTSYRSDDRRGFSGVVHLTLHPTPPILHSKLEMGYPHGVLVIPVSTLREDDYVLCRYNIARNRARFTESQTDGFLYPPFEIPVAKSGISKQTMLESYGNGQLEVLVNRQVPLLGETCLHVFHPADEQFARSVLDRADVCWHIARERTSGNYPRDLVYAERAAQFAERVLQDPSWTGFRLEFDRKMSVG